MSITDTLSRLEAVVDESSAARRVEAMLPIGGRPRQLRVRTLLVGILLSLADARPAHLTRLHEALVALPEPEQWRLGVIARWKRGPHLLTYRQVERTFSLVVPPEVMAKTAQKHDYPSKAHRVSYARRTGAERSFSTVKDPATIDLSRGWCRVMGLTSVALLVACAFLVRNFRVLDAFEARRAEDERRVAAGMPPRVRRRRRRSLADLVAAAPP